MTILEERHEVERDIEETLGLVPDFFRRVPDYLLPTEWASFKSLELSDQTAIPNKYKELIGLAVSGATRCRYCVHFHTEAARLFGATEEEVTETAGGAVRHRPLSIRTSCLPMHDLRGSRGSRGRKPQSQGSRCSSSSRRTSARTPLD